MRKIILILLVLLFPSISFAEDVKIGVIIPLTGSQAVYGIDARRIIELLSKNPGLISGSRRFQFLLEDGQCGLGNAAATAAQKLISIEKVKYLVVGCSGELLQVGPIAEKSKVVTIGFACGHPEIPKLGDYIFRTYIDLNKAVTLVAQRMMKETTGGIAVLTEESSFTLGIKKELIAQLGDRLVFADDFRNDESDFRTILSKSKKREPTAYYLNTSNPRSYENLFRQIRQLKISAPVYAYFNPADSAVLKSLARDQDGVKFVYTPDISSASPDFNNFMAEYKTSFPDGPHFEFMLRTAYDAIFSILKSINMVGDNAKLVKNFLYINEFNGALGRLKFDKYGDVENLNFVMKKIVDGQPRNVDD